MKTLMISKNCQIIYKNLYRKMDYLLEVLICRYSLYLQAFAAFFITEDVLKVGRVVKPRFTAMQSAVPFQPLRYPAFAIYHGGHLH